MNNKTSLIAGSLVLLLLVAGGIYFARTANTSSTTANADKDTQQSSVSPTPTTDQRDLLGEAVSNATPTESSNTQQAQTVSFDV